MGLEFRNKLPSSAELREQYPLPTELARVKAERDEEIKRIFRGESDRFLLIIGPCSADHPDPVLEYCNRLREVAEQVKDRLFIVPRIYTNKPRTTGEGYKGMMHQPDPEKDADVAGGIVAIRQLHMEVLKQTGFSTADEMLYPDNLRYLSDVMSYIAVGARSVENQQHRLVSSGIDVPVGMKNPTSGDLGVMLNAIYAGQHGHDFIFREWEVKSDGNPYTHAIMRGSQSKHGQMLPNYHYEDLKLLLSLYGERELSYPGCVVDTNHCNSGKKYREQLRIAQEVMHSRKYSQELAGFVRGLMVESYLEEGSCRVEEHIYGKSITDACIGWEDTLRLIDMVYEYAQQTTK
ncbi:MAG: 3-deoxy-7-phosphoheptulonate synthase [Oribacterium sp.]